MNKEIKVVYVVVNNESKIYGVKYELSDAESLCKKAQEHLDKSGSFLRARVDVTALS